ncbi:phage tail protein [Chromobacterium violaceum]|uniref:phage tail protein n=1 Tax=Chromobacterium violaceum TaxID=536 RepID=UPI000A992029|nr:phage tail protein [Chromobacterium violaceum]
MYQLSDRADVIIRIADGAHIPQGHRFWADYQAWLDQGNAPQPKESLDQLQQRLLFSLDAAADAASQIYVGKELRALEYRQAAAEAQSYKDGGCKGDAPPAVRAWAEAKGLSGKDAADGILVKAAACDQALYAIRALRLAGKEAVRQAADADAARVAAENALARLRQLAESPDALAAPAGDAANAGGFWRSSLKLFSRGA